MSQAALINGPLDGAGLRRKLREHFGFFRFRPGQAQAVRAAIEGRDTVVIMPTGSGKSVCFQLPALELEGTTVVVSPLIALMKDQADALRAREVSVVEVNSTLRAQEERDALEAIARGEVEFVYTTPERLARPDFRAILKQTPIDLFVVDEAHCASQWGHDFRPEYLGLGEAIEELGRPTVLALTATATPDVIEDIQRQLRLVDAEVVHMGVARPNLHVEAIKVDGEAGKFAEILRILADSEGSGIVYTATVRAVKELTRMLQDQGFAAAAYHGQLKASERAENQDRFMAGELKVIVATNAFGLGIDKPDIRFVVHHHAPSTIEAYYQEAGRAGRDGQPARCTLLYDATDKALHRFFQANRYPSGEDLVNAHHALKRASEGGEAPTFERLRAISPVPKTRLKQALNLFKARNVAREEEGRIRLLAPDLSMDELNRMAGDYRERDERDRLKQQQLVEFAEDPSLPMVLPDRLLRPRRRPPLPAATATTAPPDPWIRSSRALKMPGGVGPRSWGRDPRNPLNRPAESIDGGNRPESPPGGRGDGEPLRLGDTPPCLGDPGIPGDRPRVAGGLGPPDARSALSLCSRGRGAGPPRHHRRGRGRGALAGDARGPDDRADPRRPGRKQDAPGGRLAPLDRPDAPGDPGGDPGHRARRRGQRRAPGRRDPGPVRPGRPRGTDPLPRRPDRGRGRVADMTDRPTPTPLYPPASIGVIGGGQLGRMFLQAAQRMGYRAGVLSELAEGPGAQVAHWSVVGPTHHLPALRAFAGMAQAATVEFENVSAPALRWLSRRMAVRPGWRTVRVSQDRLREKSFLAGHGLPLAPWRPVRTDAELAGALAALGLPLILKTAASGYDGKGQVRVDEADRAASAWAQLGRVACVAEGWVTFASEVSVVVARGVDGESATFPVALNRHERHILDATVMPASVGPVVAQEARDLALSVAQSLGTVGVLTVEFFLTAEGRLLINELAPRPHNSGHLTIEGAVSSQFEQQVRALCGLPLGGTGLTSPAAMVNLLGDLWQGGEPDWGRMWRHDPGIKLHLYGKRTAAPGRKMGHLTVLDPDRDSALDRALAARRALTRG